MKDVSGEQIARSILQNYGIMVAFPHCKINLGLSIVAKRPDGFHDLNTVFYPIPWTDILEIIESDRLEFTSSGDLIPGNPADNLCVRAYHLMKQVVPLPPVKIHLHKILPTGAGLGGGSADGAFTLRLLNEKFKADLSIETLHAMAAKLGSDCAFFLYDTPMIGSGRGEVLTPISFSLKGKFLVLVKPTVHVSTAEAYAGVKPKEPTWQLEEVLTTRPVLEWKEKVTNDFETSVFATYPAIRGVKEKLYDLGAVYASMSGSGASVFGIFEKPVECQRHFPDFAYWAGELAV